jgi:hypothetical protein
MLAAEVLLEWVVVQEDQVVVGLVVQQELLMLQDQEAMQLDTVLAVAEHLLIQTMQIQEMDQME